MEIWTHGVLESRALNYYDYTYNYLNHDYGEYTYLSLYGLVTKLAIL